MILIFFISIGISIGYIYLLQWIIEGWDATGSYKSGSHAIKVTIIIAARNEAAFISDCLKSIYQNNYPKELVEVIVVDDDSDDSTASIIKDNFPQVRLLTNRNDPGKKAAIQLASHQAQGELLLFTDADCIVPKNWIQTLVANYDHEHIDFLAAPIQIDLEDSNLSRFQYLDVAATMAVTANGIYRKKYYSANGANMAVNRNTFLNLYPIRKDAEIASGDDMFTIQYLAKKNPSRISFVRSLEATVTTKGENTIKDLMAQRKRWAGKSKHYPEKNIILVQGYVFALVLIILANFVLGLVTDGLGVFTAVMMLFIKVTMDFLFLNYLCKYFEKEEATKKFLISAASYNVYILFAGIAALLPGKYIWKGRDVK